MSVLQKGSYDTYCVPTAWLATSSVWFRSSSSSVLCQPVWPPAEHTCVKKHRYILAFYRHSDGSEEEKVGSYIFCFSQIWFHLWSPLEHWHSWRQSWVSYSTAPAMRRRPRSSGWRVEIKNRSEFFIDLHLVDDWQGEGEDIIDIGRSCWHRGRYVERIRVGRLGKKIFLPFYSV